MHELFFTSDLHIGHVNAATKFRGFATVEEHDETLIENWNSVVRPRDTVVLLGDAAMGTVTDSLLLFRRMHGRKWLMPGNHDWVHPAHHGRAEALRKGRTAKVEEMERLYAETFEDILPLTLEMAGFTLCHFPPYGDHTAEERFAEYRPTDTGQDFLHGHVHDMWKDRENGRLINVGVDVWDFRPVNIDTLEATYP
jgi:calcineurin-like phosphoesterase family protein